MKSQPFHNTISLDDTSSPLYIGHKRNRSKNSEKNSPSTSEDTYDFLNSDSHQFTFITPSKNHSPPIVTTASFIKQKQKVQSKFIRERYNILFEDVFIYSNNKKKKLKKVSDNKELSIPLDATCAICCDSIKDLANPGCCKHDFCRVCLEQWSSNKNVCPLCKKRYHSLTVYEHNKKKEISISSPLHQEDNEEEEYDEDFLNESRCCICGSGRDEGSILICDKCGVNMSHFYCDRLKAIPTGKWYCRECRQILKEEKKLRRKIGREFTN